MTEKTEKTDVWLTVGLGGRNEYAKSSGTGYGRVVGHMLVPKYQYFQFFQLPPMIFAIQVQLWITFFSFALVFVAQLDFS